MNYNPKDVKLVLVDPKKVELSNYNGTPHLLCPVVTDPKKASVTLQKIVSEMEKRYDTFSEKGVKKISEYNELNIVLNHNSPEKEVPIYNFSALFETSIKFNEDVLFYVKSFIINVT